MSDKMILRFEDRREGVEVTLSGDKESKRYSRPYTVLVIDTRDIERPCLEYGAFDNYADAQDYFSQIIFNPRPEKAVKGKKQ